MAQDAPLVRQWLLLKTLSSRKYGVSVKEMASELGVTQKTIRRDLKTFQSVGFPLDEQVGEFGRKTWKLAPAWDRPEMSFTFEEAVALYLGRRFLEPLAGTMFWLSAQSAFKKIRASLSHTALRHLEKIAGHLHQTGVGNSDYSAKADIIDQLMIGLEDSRVVHITYHSLRATEPVTYEVHPYGMTYHRGSLFLIAFSEPHGEVRHFKVDRVHEAEVSNYPFRRPEAFDLPGHFDKVFGVFQGREDLRIVVRFEAPVVRYVTESRWHPSQQLAAQADGSLIATFQLSDAEEIKRWILSFGRHAEVLEPPQLRGEVRDELLACVQIYDPRLGHSESDHRV